MQTSALSDGTLSARISLLASALLVAVAGCESVEVVEAPPPEVEGTEVPDEAPAMSSAEERAALTAGLVADREKAQHTAEELRARVGPEEPMSQVRAVYQPADETDELAAANGG